MPELAEPIPTGYRVGILTVVRELPRQRDKWGLKRTVEVKCDCGTVKVVKWGSGVKDGYKISYSCGCIRRKLVSHNPYSPKTIAENHDKLLELEVKDKLATIKALEYIAMYGNLSDYQLSLTMGEMSRLTREVLC